MLLLTRKEQSIIILVKEYTLKEIGLMLDCSKKEIKKLLKNGRKKLC